MERADRIEAEFPPGIRMPDEMRRLCDFLDRTDYPISGYMKLRPEGEGLKLCFGADSDAWRQLAGFGAGPDGSVLASWLYNGPEVASAPVVHLGSEGDRFFVLADNFRDFLALFGIGYGELGFEDLSQPPEEPESAERLRAWLAAEFGLQCPETGSEIVQRAQVRHPDFSAWVHAAQARRDARRSCMALALGPMPVNVRAAVERLVAEAQACPREVQERPNGLRLSGGPVHCSYLDADGEVWALDLWDKSVHTVDDGPLKVGLIAIAATRVPELAEWLPRRPVNALDCQLCSMTGWLQPPLPRVQCLECHGMGWLSE